MGKRKSKKSSSMRNLFIMAVFVLGIVGAYCRFGEPSFDKTQEPSFDKAQEPGLEIPGCIGDRREVMIRRESMCISYNTEWWCPNYVAWHLTSERVESEQSRTDKFLPDPMLPREQQVVTKDYAGSGYDRGHMCPAADNKNSKEAMQESFYMTNVCPQNHNLNAGDWKELEEQCRQWVIDYQDIYIACGPIFDSTDPVRIGKRPDYQIAVPTGFFKVVLMMSKSPKALGFIYPNRATNQDIRNYCVSVDSVESLTGIDFFPSLPDDVEKKVESECRPDSWGI